MNKHDITIGLQVVTILLLGWIAFVGVGGGSDSGSSQNDVMAQARAAAGAPGTPVTSVASNQQGGPAITSTNTQQNPAAQQVEQVDPAKATTMTFENKEFDFGTVKEGEVVEHVYKFKNTGDKPLNIKNAKGSCGCTVPQWPKAPIAPGATGEINVRFDSNKKPGRQSKTVTITANTNPAQTVLTIKGEVIKQEG